MRRITVRITDEHFERLLEIKEKYGIKDISETVRFVISTWRDVQ